jgi:hypothetical protein
VVEQQFVLWVFDFRLVFFNGLGGRKTEFVLCKVDDVWNVVDSGGSTCRGNSFIFPCGWWSSFICPCVGWILVSGCGFLVVWDEAGAE